MSLVELGRFARNEAHILIGRLQSEDISAIAFDGETNIGDGSYLFIPVRVMVDEQDLPAARLVVAGAA